LTERTQFGVSDRWGGAWAKARGNLTERSQSRFRTVGREGMGKLERFDGTKPIPVADKWRRPGPIESRHCDGMKPIPFSDSGAGGHGSSWVELTERSQFPVSDRWRGAWPIELRHFDGTKPIPFWDSGAGGHGACWVDLTERTQFRLRTVDRAHGPVGRAVLTERSQSRFRTVGRRVCWTRGEA